MTLCLRTLSIETFIPMLKTLAALLDKASAHASAKNFDDAPLVDARLAPDMYTLGQQVMMACFHAEEAVARLTGASLQPPTDGADHKTLDALKERIARAVAQLEKVNDAAFACAEGRNVITPLFGNHVLELNGADFLRRWSLPHFYFHVVTAYDLFRHNGVDIGKRDFLRVGDAIHVR